ncbi:excinuclease ABC subunit UvrC [Solemya velum gill symbiont]|uniref:excinuclease ABC subunit UvrC n=1 Tax=Solemya velum gill symbiont TaxID=2340 RepID=UPI0009976C92|nr:excinuclease ABC subunit UvrC [Solemya velum gill symbiont]OOY51834.1 excinuclease ABC subunit C [Solemya velum gill symbiont]OOY55946.1 excinuclease ABC subunit C [Solemya velum gill symbiont]OOY57269.1 excinuclease ABC subunit C [Solemya velum gill symbiont]OOY60129.1 excinuclease ABC subunit C [Solemya velum gill symbiont]OOY61674.1 excinuclease ABC subunit C [Solemya velum gill symbiont]
MSEESSAFDHRAFLARLTSRPGVYRMLDANGDLLYVGKAKNLKRRVSSYFTRANSRRIQLMVAQIASIETTVTNTEAEALILENNLIKSLKPRYNILLRDDKSYPYIYLSADEFPRLSFHRGTRAAKGRYFGPYPSSGAVRETLSLLQKVFPVRQCDESYYRNRTRACLQHQIKRCTAPCVGLITKKDYQADVDNTVRFLEGRASEVIDDLTEQMDVAAKQLDYETAAAFRDRVISLRKIQERQYVSGEKGDLDIIAAASEAGKVCIQVFSIRGGRNLGNRSYFPRASAEVPLEQVVSAFLARHYIDRPVPSSLLVSVEPEDAELLAEVFSQQADRKVKIQSRVRGERLRWMRLAQENAKTALAARIADRLGVRERYEALQDALGLEEIPERMECYDISHTSGEKTVASCVVFDQQGPLTSEYRRFNIRTTDIGDDYAAMAEAIERRFLRIRKGEIKMPDLLVIDGGKGQISRVHEQLVSLGVGDVQLLGIAKGPDRKPGMEQLFLFGTERPLILNSASPALHLLQQIRDEAHRFAIAGHRQRRAKARQQSVLEGIEGIGAGRRRDLLRHFGGLQELERAGVEDIEAVKGISTALAKRIYDYLHGD